MYVLKLELRIQVRKNANEANWDRSMSILFKVDDDETVMI